MTKPRKPYRPRHIRVPMTSEARNTLALQIHASVNGFLLQPTGSSFNRVCVYISVAARSVHNERRYADPDRQLRIRQMTSLLLTAQGIFDRFERTGKLAVTEADKVGYRAAAKAVDEVLGEIDYSTFAISKEQVYTEMRELHPGWTEADMIEEA